MALHCKDPVISHTLECETTPIPMALFVRPEDELIENAARLHREREDSHVYTKPTLVAKIREYLPFRLLRVLLNDPAALLFVTSLFVFSICMPFLGLYLKHSENLLDLDTMKVKKKTVTNA